MAKIKYVVLAKSKRILITLAQINEEKHIYIYDRCASKYCLIRSFKLSEYFINPEYRSFKIEKPKSQKEKEYLVNAIYYTFSINENLIIFALSEQYGSDIAELYWEDLQYCFHETKVKTVNSEDDLYEIKIQEVIS